MRRVLCLYLRQWPIQRVLGERDSAVPILLHARDPRRGELIVACNEAAKARGVRVGMPLAEAEALAGHGGGECCIWPHDAAGDLAALANLAEHCERFSPMVGWETAEGMRNAECGMRSEGPDCLFL